MTIRSSTWASACIILLVAGCAAYRPGGASFRSARDMTTQEVQDKVIWAADGLSGGEFDRIYDWKFGSKGFSSAVVAVRNEGDMDIRFSWQDVAGAVDPEEVIKAGKRSNLGRQFAWHSVLAVELLVGGAMIWVDGITLSICGLVDAGKVNEANQRMADDIRRQSVRDTVVGPGRSYEGLVYFRGTPTRVGITYRYGTERKEIELPWR